MWIENKSQAPIFFNIDIIVWWIRYKRDVENELDIPIYLR